MMERWFERGGGGGLDGRKAGSGWKVYTGRKAKSGKQDGLEREDRNGLPEPEHCPWKAS